MAGNLIVGFAPAAAGGGGKGATSFSPAAEQTEGPLGLFGALLGAATVEETATLEFAVAGEAAFDTATASLLDVSTTPGVEFSVEAPKPPELEHEALLADLVDALATIDRALADGEPVSPALAEKVSDALDALADVLGIALPADPLADPALAPAAGPVGATPPPVPSDIDALLALAAAAPPALESESTFVPVPAAGGAEAAIAFSVPTVPAVPTEPAATTPALVAGVTEPIIPGVPTEIDPALPLPQATGTAETAETAPSIDPNSGLGQLIKKISDLALALEPQSPGLAKRLEALAQKLTSGEVSTQVLADLGIDTGPSLSDNELEQALQRLLAASSEVKGTPAPPAFAAAQLKLPEAIALPSKAESPTRPELPIGAPSAPEPEPEPEIAAKASPHVALEPRGPEARESAEPRPPAHNNFGDSVKAAVAKADAPVEPGQPAQSTAQAAVAAATAVVGTKAIHAAYQAPVQQINIPQVAFEVVRQVQAGNSRFQIRLDPPELGRIDVKLDVDGNGNVNARMTVERAETLDLMQRDQRALERALAQAGLDSSKTNLEFSLRQNPFAREDGGDGRGKGSPFGGGNGETAGPVEDIPEQTQTVYRGSTSASGVNLFV